MPRSLGTVVQKEFRDALREIYPKVFENPQRISFLRHTLFLQDEYADSDSGFERTNGKNLYHEKIKRYVLRTRDRGFPVMKFITEFQDFIDFPLNVTDYSIKDGLAREFSPELPKHIEQMLIAELKIPVREKINPVYFQDGTVYSETKQSKIRRDMHAEHYRDNKPTGVILNYFKDINPVAYNPYRENVDNLIKQVSRDAEHMPTDKVKAHLLHLNSLAESLEPYYFENNPYERVWTEGVSLQNIKREHRKDILKGCIEADLTSAHLSIAAYDWNIPSLKNLLEQDINIWKHIHKELDIEFSPETKAGFKIGVYAIIYGGGESTIREKMGEESIESEIIEKFLKVPIILDLMEAGKIERDKATKQKWVYLANGDKLYSRKANGNQKAIKPYALVSWRAISIERYLIESCFEVATKYPKDFRILSLEHDGFTFAMLDKSKEKTVWNRLAKAVAERGKELGIRISLEQK